MVNTIDASIGYIYLFNYIGKEIYKEHIVSGAEIGLAIKVYKNDELLVFDEEVPAIENKYALSDCFVVSFDREKGYKITENERVLFFFKELFGFDKIEAEPVEFSLSVFGGFLSDDEEKNLPEEIKHKPVSVSLNVEEDELKEFLITHADDFDISDNESAQVPAVWFFTDRFTCSVEDMLIDLMADVSNENISYEDIYNRIERIRCEIIRN